MDDLTDTLQTDDSEERRKTIVSTLVNAFSDLMSANPSAFRTKFRKMAADPFAFYRGSACLFYADVAKLTDPWADDHTSRVWIQGDLHAENFGTYMNGQGRMIFDVNDFDEAYVGHFTWDLQRFVASIALMGRRKAISDAEIGRLVPIYVRAYADQVRRFALETGDQDYSLRLDNTEGVVHQTLLQSKLRSRAHMLDHVTEVRGYERRFRDGPGVRQLDEAEKAAVCAAFEEYQESIPYDKRFSNIAYNVKDVVGRSGFGIGSAGLPAYNILIEGFSEALDNDIVLSMKQGNVAAPSRIVSDPQVASYFPHHGHRTAVSQRALQAHADPLLGYTELGGAGFVVSELGPYNADLEWEELTEPSDIAPVLDYLGRATAKVHCVADSDSDQTLVPFQTEQALQNILDGREEEFVAWLVDFAHSYAQVVRNDHQLFLDAFRENQIPGVRSTE